MDDGLQLEEKLARTVTMFANLLKTDVAKRTFTFDSCRCFCAGIIEAGFNGFALLIAIRVFHASKITKSLLTAAWVAGYFIEPITQELASRTKNLKVSQICSRYMLCVAALVVISIFAKSFAIFLPSLMLAMILFKQPVSLMADVYGQNYISKERGKGLAVMLMILPIATITFSPIGGKLMDFNIQNYKIVMAIVAIAALGSAWAFSKIPSRVLPNRGGKSIFSNFKIIFKDKLFGMMLLWWTFAGVANQMTKPLRAEYLVNSEYGINASNLFETLACVTIPFGCRVLSSLSWGKLFDKYRIVTVKLLVNLFLMVGFWLFFHSESKHMISLAAVIMGIGYGGGEVLWGLWVTKITNKENFSSYMSANVAVVGLRGLISPFLGYGLLHYFSLKQISWIAAALVLISSLGFLSLKDHPRFREDYS